MKYARSLSALKSALCFGLCLAVGGLPSQAQIAPEAALRSLAKVALPIAQGEFLHRPSATPGCNGLVTSSATLGNGDVIFGGNFTQCGAIRANRVVRFDGVNFYSVGNGLENGVGGVVRTVFVDGEQIYVGGEFSTAGSATAKSVAVFDGTQWRSVGRGSSNGVPGAVVRALHVFEGKLYVGGHTVGFEQALLREWNGASWRDVQAFRTAGSTESVNAFAVMNNSLYFGGTFRLVGSSTYQNLGIFSGGVVSYTDFPSGPAFSRVRDLHVFQGQMCVAGTFNLGNQAGGVACRGAGGWQSFGLSAMRAMADDGNTLFAAGYDVAGTGSVYALGQTSFVRGERTTQDFALTLAPHANGILLGGSFAQTITPAHGLLRLSQGQFSPLHTGTSPNLAGAFQYFESAGSHTLALSLFNQPHPAPSPGLFERVGNRWLAIDAPVNSKIETLRLLSANNSVFLADAGTDELFRWNGTSWDSQCLNCRVNGVYANRLIRMDSPNAQGARAVHQLGENGLQPLLTIPPLRRNGQLFNGFTSLPVTLVEYLGKPVIAGRFDFIDGFGPIDGVAILEDGVWRQLGGGLRDPKWTNTQQFLQINLLAVGNELYASNGFTEAEGAFVDGIARFDGVRWQRMGAGLMQSDAVAARAQVKMIRYHEKLYAYGVFDRADNQPASNIAQWDGDGWRTLGPEGAEGIQGEGALIAAVVGDELHFSGEVHAAGGEPAEYYAVWRDGRLFASGFE